MYSVAEADLKQLGWVRTGTNISYYKNNFTVFGNPDEKFPSKKKTKMYYTLTFTVVFQHDKDVCYFAYHYPYTYSMLLVSNYCECHSIIGLILPCVVLFQTDLEAIKDTVKSRDLYYHRQPLCTTLCGNTCPLITISSGPCAPQGKQRQHIYSYRYYLCDRTTKMVLVTSITHNLAAAEGEKDSKKYIVLSARVHPGESNSSWVMKGLLQHLVSDHPDAKALRERFVFKIIPMLNPDGVIHGRYVCACMFACASIRVCVSCVHPVCVCVCVASGMVIWGEAYSNSHSRELAWQRGTSYTPARARN